MNYSCPYEIPLFNCYNYLPINGYQSPMFYPFVPLFYQSCQNVQPFYSSTLQEEISPPIKKTYLWEIKQMQSPDSNFKKQQVAQTNNSSSGDQFQSVKSIQNKTKDLMRPFARMLYRYFKKIVENGSIIDKNIIEEIKHFNEQVDELRSKNPCKFTEVIMSFIRSVSPCLRMELDSYLQSTGFINEILRSDSFKHWKNRTQLINFLKQFVGENKLYLKPTKFYKFQFKKLL